ncbi:hypothetical protein Agub_g7893, partial [Astrephomene gubernaculifera]
GGSQLPSFGATRRVILGRRSSGVVLGDDLLREKRLTVGVVAVSRCVVLAVSPQRFTSCCDPLTLRLFHKLRLQHSATGVFTDALRGAEQRQAMGALFREAVLGQSYGQGPPGALRREGGSEGKPWKAPSGRPEELSLTADQLHRAAGGAASGGGAGGGGGGASSGGGAAGAASTAATSHSHSHAHSHSHSHAHSHPHAASAAASAASAAAAAGSAGGGGGGGGGGTSDGGGGGGGGGGGKLYGGLTVSLVLEAVGKGAESGSMATFLQRMKASETAHQHHLHSAATSAGGATSAAAAAYPSAAAAFLPAWADVDLSQQVGCGSGGQQRMYTDMLEAACMAVIKVDLAPGQLDVRLDTMAQVLDDIVVQWSDLAHRCGLQLVRWRTLEYFLVVPLELGGGAG